MLGEKRKQGVLRRRLDDIMSLQESIHQERVGLSWCTEREIFAEPEPVQCQLSAFLALFFWKSCSADMAFHNWNLCWWSLRGPFWCSTIVLPFSNCLCFLASFLLSCTWPIIISLPFLTLYAHQAAYWTTIYSPSPVWICWRCSFNFNVNDLL